MTSRVAASERDLLMVTRALIGKVPVENVAPLMGAHKAVSPTIGPTAMRLFKQTLSRGLPLTLARRGGWQHDAYLSADGEVVSGRLWQRRRPPRLTLTGFSFRLCRLLAGQVSRAELADVGLGNSPRRKPDERDEGRLAEPLAAERITLGDQLVLYLACDLAERAGLLESSWLGAVLTRLPAMGRTPLFWLAFPELLVARDGSDPVGDVSPLFEGDGATLFEALQVDLARRVVALERKKRRWVDPEPLVAIARLQHAVFETLMQHASAARRRDLLMFVPLAAEQLLRSRPRAVTWRPPFVVQSSLMQRAAGNEAAALLFDVLAALERWMAEARATPFFEDDYDASQLLLRKWDRLEGGTLDHARRLGCDLRAMPSVVDDCREDRAISQQGEMR